MSLQSYRIGSLASSKQGETSFMIEHSPLSEEWYLNMRNETSVLWKLSVHDTQWRASHENHKELTLFIETHKYVLDVSREIHLLSDKTQDAMVKLTQLITNCIVSFTTFLTICEQYMEKEFTQNKMIYDKWNDARKDLHKNSFEYRLGYDLRNYSQHYGVPISGIALTMNSQSIKKLEAYIDIDSLLSGGFNWKSRADELKKIQSSEIDLIELLKKYLTCIDIVYLNTLQAHSDALTRCNTYIAELCQSYNIDSSAHPVVFKGNIPSGEKIPKEKEFIPLYLLNRYKSEWLEKLNFNIG
ncbi:hypothetical protein [Aeromonas veronii]|uniref:hypothetical protein n=1 Tax=Aeromonas veronii TaxID=654 RepID=UPI003D22C3AE